MRCEDKNEWTRYTWTSEEISEVSAIFSPEEIPEALKLFAPDDWAAMSEDLLMTPNQLQEELERMRAEAEHYRVASEFGFDAGEAALMRVRSMIAMHDGAREDAGEAKEDAGDAEEMPPWD